MPVEIGEIHRSENPTISNNTLSFINIVPTIENKKILRVRHPNHQLVSGTIVIISHSGPVNQVPPSAINKEQIISRILDDDHYEILIDKYTPIVVPAEVDNLNIISIIYPDIFQMFFNYSDTLGNILSFNKVGQEVAITRYQHTIKNTDPYANDYNYDALGNEYQQGLKKLDMTGDIYFYVSIEELGDYHNTLPVRYVFSKIRWFDDPGNVVFDSFVPSTSIFEIPISFLTELNIGIFHTNGKLVDFNGLDHSFTIEIVEVYNQPDETDINVRIDSEMIVRRVP